MLFNLFITTTEAEVQIVLKRFFLFFGHFCFVVVYAKTLIHTSVGGYCKDVHLNTLCFGEYPWHLALLKGLYRYCGIAGCA
jgi:hypothetical protein